jgi:hypothetical protein
MNNSLLEYLLQAPEIKEYLSQLQTMAAERQNKALENLIWLLFIEPLGGIIFRGKKDWCWCGLSREQGQESMKKISQLLERLEISEEEFVDEAFLDLQNPRSVWQVMKKVYLEKQKDPTKRVVFCWTDDDIAEAIRKILFKSMKEKRKQYHNKPSL